MPLQNAQELELICRAQVANVIQPEIFIEANAVVILADLVVRVSRSFHGGDKGGFAVPDILVGGVMAFKSRLSHREGRHGYLSNDRSPLAGTRSLK